MLGEGFWENYCEDSAGQIKEFVIPHVAPQFAHL